jgi:hypothetical protein
LRRPISGSQVRGDAWSPTPGPRGCPMAKQNTTQETVFSRDGSSDGSAAGPLSNANRHCAAVARSGLGQGQKPALKVALSYVRSTPTSRRADGQCDLRLRARSGRQACSGAASAFLPGPDIIRVCVIMQEASQRPTFCLGPLSRLVENPERTSAMGPTRRRRKPRLRRCLHGDALSPYSDNARPL